MVLLTSFGSSGWLAASLVRRWKSPYSFSVFCALAAAASSGELRFSSVRVRPFCCLVFSRTSWRRSSARFFGMVSTLFSARVS